MSIGVKPEPLLLQLVSLLLLPLLLPPLLLVLLLAAAVCSNVDQQRSAILNICGQYDPTARGVVEWKCSVGGVLH